MAFYSFLILALIVVSGQVNGQFGFNRERDDQIAQGCESKVMDIFFILDSSSSIYINDYHSELQFARDLVSRLDVRPDSTRVGALTFSDDYQRPAIGLTRFSSRQDAMAGINNNSLPYRKGITNTDKAIRYVNELNEFREDITKVIVVVTDGGSRSPGSTAAQAERARENGFYLFVVGVGQYLDEGEWRAIANDPDENFLYNITNYRFLDSIKFTLPPRACSLPPIILRKTCTVDRQSEVYFVASDSTSDEAIRMIENFKENTRDTNEELSLNYMIEDCNYATNVRVRDVNFICDRFSRRLPNTPSDASNLMTRAMNAARDTRNSVSGVSQTIIIYVDDRTLSNSGQSLIQSTLQAQQSNIRIVVVDLGVRNYRAFLNRLTSRENVISYRGQSVDDLRQSRNDMIERVCETINFDQVRPTFDFENTIVT